MVKLSLRFGSLTVGWLAIGAILPLQAAEPADPQSPSTLIRASLRTVDPIVQAGRPVWVEFSLTNLTSDQLMLRVPGVETLTVPTGGSPEGSSLEMGLPLAHVFSGLNFGALLIEDHQGRSYESEATLKPRKPVPEVRLAPLGGIGRRVELTQYYELLRRPGKYRLVWSPYRGWVESPPLSITVLAERQAMLLTDLGNMTMRFRYQEAPHHVENFIELIESGLYRNLTFHRVVPGGLIQGGDPRGDGRGSRPDGKRVKAEFSQIPFELGTVGMARSRRDPDSASCQFFICLSRQTSFDGQQTAFGYLVGDESFETLRKIAAVPTGPKDRPLQPVYIRSISLENVPPQDREPRTRPAGSRAPRRSSATAQGRSGIPSRTTQDHREISAVRRLTTSRPAAESGGS